MSLFWFLTHFLATHTSIASGEDTDTSSKLNVTARCETSKTCSKTELRVAPADWAGGERAGLSDTEPWNALRARVCNGRKEKKSQQFSLTFYLFFRASDAYLSGAELAGNVGGERHVGLAVKEVQRVLDLLQIKAGIAQIRLSSN